MLFVYETITHTHTHCFLRAFLVLSTNSKFSTRYRAVYNTMPVRIVWVVSRANSVMTRFVRDIFWDDAVTAASGEAGLAFSPNYNWHSPPQWAYNTSLNRYDYSSSRTIRARRTGTRIYFTKNVYRSAKRPGRGCSVFVDHTYYRATTTLTLVAVSGDVAVAADVRSFYLFYSGSFIARLL